MTQNSCSCLLMIRRWRVYAYAKMAQLCNLCVQIVMNDENIIPLMSTRTHTFVTVFINRYSIVGRVCSEGWAGWINCSLYIVYESHRFMIDVLRCRSSSSRLSTNKHFMASHWLYAQWFIEFSIKSGHLNSRCQCEYEYDMPFQSHNRKREQLIYY